MRAVLGRELVRRARKRFALVAAIVYRGGKDGGGRRSPRHGAVPPARRGGHRA